MEELLGLSDADFEGVADDSSSDDEAVLPVVEVSSNVSGTSSTHVAFVSSPVHEYSSQVVVPADATSKMNYAEEAQLAYDRAAKFECEGRIAEATKLYVKAFKLNPALDGSTSGWPRHTTIHSCFAQMTCFLIFSQSQSKATTRITQLGEQSIVSWQRHIPPR